MGKEVDEERSLLNKTKVLHKEWGLAVKSLKLKSEALQAEIKSIQLSIDIARKTKEQSESGLDRLMDEYNSIVVAVNQYSSTKFEISMEDYNKLEKRDEILSALEAGGVDNWDWYGESLSGVDRG